MQDVLMTLLAIIATAGIGGSAFFFITNKNTEKKLKDKKFLQLSEEEAIEKASDKARIKLLETQKQATKLKADAEAEIEELYKRVDEQEKRITLREQKIIEREKTIDDRFDSIEKKEQAIEQAKKDVKKMRGDIQIKLEKVASMTKEEAEKELKTQVEEDLKDFVAKQIRKSENEMNATVESKARELLVDVMQKSATDYIVETTATTIDIPGEEVKGKIIGKDGRNIRTFERLTGVDIIIDEAPDQVTLSSFDPIRREVAAVALQKLLADGRVHPGTMEETIRKTKAEIATVIRKTGEDVAYKAGFTDFPMEIIKLLGRFKYRFSYGQNLVKHSLEMVNIGAQLASEIGADVNMVKKACLLHDIGKVLIHEIEGKPHHHISGDIVRKYLKDEKLANAVESHHGDIPP
jgi:ribonuclease Y